MTSNQLLTKWQKYFDHKDHEISSYYTSSVCSRKKVTRDSNDYNFKWICCFGGVFISLDRSFPEFLGFNKKHSMELHRLSDYDLQKFTTMRFPKDDDDTNTQTLEAIFYFSVKLYSYQAIFYPISLGWIFFVGS